MRSRSCPPIIVKDTWDNNKPRRGEFYEMQRIYDLMEILLKYIQRTRSTQNAMTTITIRNNLRRMCAPSIHNIPTHNLVILIEMLTKLIDENVNHTRIIFRASTLLAQLQDVYGSILLLH
jgi:hypothetical protein